MTNAEENPFANSPDEILMIGGVDKDGSDVTNDLSYLVLEAASEVKLAQPAIALRVHDGTPGVPSGLGGPT